MRTITKLVAVAAAVLITTVSIIAQSTDPSSPTPVNGQYKGKGPSAETNYYFSVTAGPGDVTVGLEIKAKDYSTFARLEIGNNPSNLIAMHNMNASTTTGTASVTKQFKLAEKQSVRIKLILDANLAEYTLSVNGGGGVLEGGSGNTQSIGKLGKAGAGSGSKIGALGSNGTKPKVGTQTSDGGNKAKLNFMCPAEVMYKIVPVADWDPTIYSLKKLVFQDAGVDGPLLWCNYSTTNDSIKDSTTLVKNAPSGYACSADKGGGKNREFVCTPVAVSSLIPPRQVFEASDAGAAFR